MTERLYVFAFAFYALVATILIAFRLPPFMAPDELNHIKRANLLTHGTLLGERIKEGTTLSAGGDCEPSLDAAERPFQRIVFHPERKVRPEDSVLTSGIPWGNRVVKETFENTAIYPPTFYLPETAGIEAGKLLGEPVLRTVQIARLMNALACIAIGCVALIVCRRCGPLIFAALLLPMSVMLYSSVTQDGMLLVTAALAGAILSRGLSEGRPLTKGEVWGTATCLALIGMAKLPFALLILLMFIVKSEPRRLCWVAGSVAALVVGAWQVLTITLVQVPFHRPDVALDPGAQLRFLTSHPFAAFSVAFHTMRRSPGEYVTGMIGNLGWLDTPMPKAYYLVALAALATGAALIFSARPVSLKSRPVAVLVVLALTAIAIFGALYLGYTAVGNPYVEGVQGRYFLPLLVMLPVAFVGTDKEFVDRFKPAVSKAMTALVLAFPAVSIVVIDRVLLARYY